MKYVIYDTETTGLNPLNSFILSIGSICVDDNNILDYLNSIKKANNNDVEEIKVDKWGHPEIIVNNKYEFHKFLNWFSLNNNFNIPEDTIKVHGLTEDYIKNNGFNPINVFEEYSDFLKDRIGDDEVCFVAFNEPYDLNMFVANLKHILNIFNSRGETNDKIMYLLNLLTNRKSYIIDNLIIDRILHFEVDGVKVRHDLQSVGIRYGFDKDINAHDALSDSKRTILVWNQQLKELKEYGLEINHDFEGRLKRAYDKYSAKFSSRRQLDYFAENMEATR